MTDDGPNMEFRALIAVLLSLVVMVAFQYLYAPQPDRPGGEEPRAVAEEGRADSPTGAAETRRSGEEPGSAEGPRTGQGDAGRDDRPLPEVDETAAHAAAGVAEDSRAATRPGADEEAVALPSDTPVSADSEQRVVVANEGLEITLTNRGGRLRSVLLDRYAADDGGPLELVVGAFAATGRLPLDLVTPERPELARSANQALYVTEVSGGAKENGLVRAGADDPVVVRFSWSDPAVGSVVKQLRLTAGELQEVEVRASFAAETPTFLALGPGLVAAEATSSYGYLSAGALVHRNGELKHWTADDLEEPTRLQGDTRWLGQESNYFLALLIPNGLAETYLYAEAAGSPTAGDSGRRDGEGAEASNGQGEGQPGEAGGGGDDEPDGQRLARVALRIPEQGLATPLYIGPKDYNQLSQLGYDLHEAVDFGFFSILAIPLYKALVWTYQYVNNYGLAIILLTVVIKVLFLPLTHKSFVSMQRMRELQPKMNSIKSKYKGKKDLEARQQMNQEVMELYKKEGVSPFGGCMPMLLQIPVLFAFYAVLSLAIELRHAPFVLWVHDLSKADPYWILPILMGASMYAQQSMSPTTADPTQARMFKFLPVFMTALFVTLPSGLVLYWFVNNLLGIGQQVYIQRRLNPEPDSKGHPNKAKKGRKGKRGKK